MQSKVRTLSILYAIFLVVPCICLVNADEIKTISLLPNKDTYVSSEFPTQINGNANFLYFGDYINGITETFISFDISSEYSDIITAELQFQGVSFDSGNDTYSYPIWVRISVITNNWGEMTLNWVNKPSPIQDITTFKVYGFSWAVGENPIFYKKDVTHYIQSYGSSDSFLSICLNVVVNVPQDHGYMAIPSRERHDGNLLFGPLLNLTYKEQPTESALPLMQLILGTVGFIGMVGSSIYLYHTMRRNPKKIEKNNLNT
jgi:hypothetical protein